MILLDTNVLSAIMRDAPDAAVEEWLDAQPAESIWTTTITVFEIRFGLTLLPPSRRRDRLELAFEQATDVILEGRVLSFDSAAARAAAAIAAERRLRGQTIEIRDARSPA